MNEEYVEDGSSTEDGWNCSTQSSEQPRKKERNELSWLRHGCPQIWKMSVRNMLQNITELRPNLCDHGAKSMGPTDILIYVMPMPIVWHLRTSKRRKIKSSLVFLLGGMFVIHGS